MVGWFPAHFSLSAHLSKLGNMGAHPLLSLPRDSLPSPTFCPPSQHPEKCPSPTAPRLLLRSPKSTLALPRRALFT